MELNTNEKASRRSFDTHKPKQLPVKSSSRPPPSRTSRCSPPSCDRDKDPSLSLDEIKFCRTDLDEAQLGFGACFPAVLFFFFFCFSPPRERRV